MKEVRKGMIIDINLDPAKGAEKGKIRPYIVVTNNIYNKRLPVIQVTPITEWSEKKSRVITNVELDTEEENGLTKKSIADSLQTRPIDYKERMIKIRGKISKEKISEIDKALKLVFGID